MPEKIDLSQKGSLDVLETAKRGANVDSDYHYRVEGKAEENWRKDDGKAARV